MKRILAILLVLALALSVGCYRLEFDCGTRSNGAEDDPEPAAAETDLPEIPESGSENTKPQAKMIDVFKAYERLEENQTEALMFRYDLDNDGTEEDIGVKFDIENDTCTITDGERSVMLQDSANLTVVYLCDLDPASPYRNLIVCADWASDDYVTTVMHPEGGELIVDRLVYGYVSWEEDAFEVSESSYLFGTRSGTRYYYGDTFETDSEWLECWVPSQQDLAEDREWLFEGGTLLHLIRDLPCTINGQPALITAGNCIFLVRYNDPVTQAEICTEDGSVHAMVAVTYDENEWSYKIDGHAQDEYFDNLCNAD